MIPTIFTIAGPLKVNSYGLMIALGVILFTWRCLKTKPLWLSKEQVQNLIFSGIIGGVIGGRLINWFTNPEHFPTILKVITPWIGGFSVSGAVLGILGAVIFFTKKETLPFLSTIDLIGLNAGLLQSLSRIGCFLAGCCHGLPSSTIFSITYTHPETLAPCGIPLQPVQLYASLALLSIFFLMQWLKPFLKKPGQIITLYLLLFSTQRFIFDFIRSDRTFLASFDAISIDQIIVCCIGIVSLFSFILISIRQPNKNNETRSY